MLVSFLSLACLLLIPSMLLLAFLPFAGVPLALDAGHLHVSLTFAGVPCVDDKNGNRPMAEKQDGTEILMRLTEQYLENSKRFQRSKQKL
jgi:hypothetical protein